MKGICKVCKHYIPNPERCDFEEEGIRCQMMHGGEHPNRFYKVDFAKLAEAFVDGDNLTHRLSGHTEAECLGWQKGAKEFAAWIDAGRERSG